MAQKPQQAMLGLLAPCKFKFPHGELVEPRTIFCRIVHDDAMDCYTRIPFTA